VSLWRQRVAANLAPHASECFGKRAAQAARPTLLCCTHEDQRKISRDRQGWRRRRGL